MSMFGSANVVRTRDYIPGGEDAASTSIVSSSAAGDTTTTTSGASGSGFQPPDSTKLWNEGKSMSSAMSLRERMKTYQALRAEAAGGQQPSITSGSSSTAAPEFGGSDDNSYMPPGGATASAATASMSQTIPEEGASRSMEPPDESWVPPPPPARQEVSEGDDDEYEEEEFEDESEEIVADDEYEEVELAAATAAAAVAAGGGGGGEDDTLDEEQGIFQALDEAEKAEKAAIKYDNKDQRQSRALPAEQPAAKAREPLPEKESGDIAKQRCTVAGVLFVGAIAIAALVVPFVYDYPNRNTSGDEPTPSSPTSPTAPTAPAPSLAPTLGPGETLAPTVTDSSTASPTTLRFNQFLESFLIPISGSEVFEDPESPQFRAGFFISEEDPYTSQLTTVEQLEDRYASITFYYATNGDDWLSCSSTDTSCTEGPWLVDDVCGWSGVGCTEAGRISSIEFASNNGLEGTLPHEMYLLSELSDLVIANNTLTGQLPLAFGENATSMAILALPGNQLSGFIPENYLSNSPVERIFLEDNQFMGTVPTNLGNSTTLTLLDLSNNGFTGGIPEEISNYESLLVLDLSANELDGQIPESLFSLSNLARLYLDGNRLTGSLSPLIRNLLLLEELRLGDSEMTGFLPDELVLLNRLRELDVSGAQFEGQMPQGLGLLAASLRVLRMDDNLFVGTVPVGWGALTNLNVMELHVNGFTGSIPDSICQLRVNASALQVLTADCEEVSCSCCSECF